MFALYAPSLSFPSLVFLPANTRRSSSRLLPRRAAAVFTRNLHKSLPAPTVPPPTAAVPDVPTFLSQIGRDCTKHAPKFSDWTQLFSATSAQLKELGVEPARTRKYILRWREKYRILNGNIRLLEQKRGHKIDGGERRRKEFRAKQYAEERKAAEAAANR
jgi:hypothetical protein